MYESATAQRVRVIGIDRPGFGLSTPRQGRTLLDWPDDVAEVATQLEIQRFSVAGVSGGGPYALACAVKLRDRIDAVGIISGMGPFDHGVTEMRVSNQRLFRLAANANWLLRLFLWLGVGRFSRDAERLQEIVPRMMSDLPEPDRILLEGGDLQRRVVLELQEAFRQGARWVAKEGAIYTKPWGFSFRDIPNIPTFLWHGELDLNVPISMSCALVEQMPHVKATFDPAHGHISMFAANMDSVLQALCPANTKNVRLSV